MPVIGKKKELQNYVYKRFWTSKTSELFYRLTIFLVEEVNKVHGSEL